MGHELSDATIAIHRNLKDRGELISDEKKIIIDSFAGVAEKFADKAVEKSGITNSEDMKNLWNSIFHPYMDKSLKKEGLRV